MLHTDELQLTQKSEVGYGGFALSTVLQFVGGLIAGFTLLKKTFHLLNSVDT